MNTSIVNRTFFIGILLSLVFISNDLVTILLSSRITYSETFIFISTVALTVLVIYFLLSNKNFSKLNYSTQIFCVFLSTILANLFFSLYYIFFSRVFFKEYHEEVKNRLIIEFDKLGTLPNAFFEIFNYFFDPIGSVLANTAITLTFCLILSSLIALITSSKSNENLATH